MKTFYWSFVLMLLPSMAYTQTTEKEMNFDVYANQTSCGVSKRMLSPCNEGQKAASFINKPCLVCHWTTSARTLKSRCRHSMFIWGQDPQIDKNGRFILNEA